jgi:hypothetical protein
LGVAERWLDALRREERALSQADLIRQFHALSSNDELSLDLRTEWLDSGWQAVPGPIREGSCTVSVILPDDEQACRDSSLALINRSIPMNFCSKRGMQHWREFKGNFIAPVGASDYDKEIGATWRSK